MRGDRAFLRSCRSDEQKQAAVWSSRARTFWAEGTASPEALGEHRPERGGGGDARHEGRGPALAPASLRAVLP